MISGNDHNYFVTRAREEAGIGEETANQKVAAIHFEMAYRYALLAYGPPTAVLIKNSTFVRGAGAFPSAPNFGPRKQTHHLAGLRERA